MSDNKNKDNQSEFDIFIANSIFPEASSLFATHLKPVEDVKNTAVIVLDTNALLVPYGVGKDSLTQIQQTYRQLVENGQIKVPGQVAREFAKNRAQEILDVYQQLSRKQSSLPSPQIDKYPLLESVKEYQETLRLVSEIDAKIKEYRNAIRKVLDHIRNWTWNDPVSSVYSELFNETVIFDPKLDEQKIKAELARRQLHKIPPGYKDAGKSDSGIGDLLIWFTILEIGKESNKDLIFVSGDQKPDWWHVTEKQAIYPRFELVDEYRRESGGCSFHIIQFSQFLDLFGASESAVEEVREEEKRIIIEYGYLEDFTHDWQELERTLYTLYFTKNPDKKRKLVSLLQILRFLIQEQTVDADVASAIVELSKFRNNLAHGGTGVSQIEIQSRIRTLQGILNHLRSTGKID